MKSGRGLWVAGNVKFASVCGNEGIPAHKPFWQEAKVKMAKDVPERFREEFCPLLDKSESSRDLVGQEIKIFQQFMSDAAAFHAEEETDQLYPPPNFRSRVKSLPGYLTNWAVLQAMLSTIAQSVDLTFCGKDI